MFKWLRNLFKTQPRQLVFVPFDEANRLIGSDPKMWRIAPEEDHNYVPLMVFLERDVSSGDGKRE